MSTAHQEDISSSVLRRMKEGGFDFSRFHPDRVLRDFPGRGAGTQGGTVIFIMVNR